MEKTLIILKPSIPESEKQISITKSEFQKKFFEIIESKWFKIEKLKKIIMDDDTAREHYAEKKDHPLFNSVIKYITSDVSIILSISWDKAIAEVRKIALSMREEYIWNSKLYNLIHSSDSKHESEREHNIHFWLNKKHC